MFNRLAEGWGKFSNFCCVMVIPKQCSPKGSCEREVSRRKVKVNCQEKHTCELLLLQVKSCCTRSAKVYWFFNLQEQLASIFSIFRFCLYNFKFFLLFNLPLKAHGNLALCLCPPTVIKKTESVLRNIKLTCKIMKS